MRFTRAAALLAVATIALSGCTSKNDAPKKPAAGTSPGVTIGTGSPSATGSASPTSTPTLPDIPDAFLPAGLVPGLNASWQWQDGTSSHGDGKPFGVCAKADLASIGADKVGERTYFPPDDSDDSAAQLVARFPDAKSAAQAWSVLESWRSRCAATIGAALGPKVGSETAVKLPDKAVGRWYLVSWNPAGEETGRFEAFGMVRQGSLISVLRITNSGQDYNYPRGEEPMTKMVQLAGLRLFAGFGKTQG
ncbi:hypothetical protein [Nocardioides marmorisolisilvae]|uniref:Sensor domain-containing protein n=1 Tax=Nocardioides marmorisolisilvae TaxID=1542737 RepID=A0A3N0DU45_9ACTN|nr:hypothetical protein [Nocardioides marmorisolisilvae]RNL79120.1 hypothetical protein EFL95_08785 [Nocardioides marmorisolisilvae]